MPQPTQTTQPPQPKKTWLDYLNDVFDVATGEKYPTFGATIDNVPEIRNNLLIVVGVALGGYLLVKLVLIGIASATSK